MAPTHHWTRAACFVAVAGCMVAGAMGCTRAPMPGTAAVSGTAQGRDVYVHRCASCHGVDGRGDGPVAPSLRTAPPDLTRLAAAAGTFPRDRIVAVVSGEVAMPAHGTREMPVWSRRFGASSGATAAAAIWSSRNLDALTSYLETIQQP
jgi:mono/diheme cytochrome c family protein